MTVTTYTMTSAYPYKAIPQEWIDFPGGEQHVNYTPDEFNTPIQVIRWDGADPADFMRVAMWADAVDRTASPSTMTALMLPYLPGARMDRGKPLGAKVYADLINSLKFDAVVTVDPHSDVMPALIDRLEVVTIPEIIPPRIGYDGIIIPDAGAGKRAESVATLFALPTIQALKHRDFGTGKLSGFKLADDVKSGGRYLVVDDICDGGGTFAGLHAEMPRDCSLDLWVTHGIFSGLAPSNLGVYHYIYTTDSHPGHRGLPGAHITPLAEPMAKKIWKALS